MMSEHQHLVQILSKTVKDHPNKKALAVTYGDHRQFTWKDVWDRVRQLAIYLKELGVKEGDRVALWSTNRPEWFITDFAIFSLNAVTVPIYATLSETEVRYILENSEARVLVISSIELFNRLDPLHHSPKGLETVLLMEGKPDLQNRGERTAQTAPSLNYWASGSGRLRRPSTQPATSGPVLVSRSD